MKLSRDSPDEILHKDLIDTLETCSPGLLKRIADMAIRLHRPGLALRVILDRRAFT
jgi:hypothetical protein